MMEQRKLFMNKRRPLVSVMIILLLCSCTQKNKESYSTFVDSFLVNIGTEQNDIYHTVLTQFDEKLKDPRSHRKAIRFEPAVRSLQQKKTIIDLFFDSLYSTKHKDLRGNGFIYDIHLLSDSLVAWKSFLDSVSRLFVIDEVVIQENLENEIVVLNKKIFPILNQLDSGQVENSKNVAEKIVKFTSGLNDVEQHTFLTIVETKCKNAIIQLLTYLDLNSVVTFCGYERRMPLVNLNASTLEPGENLHITAGLGNFSIKYLKKVIIDGQPFTDANTEGLISYTLKAPLRKGRYKIPLKFEFLLPDGTIEYYSTHVAYTVK